MILHGDDIKEAKQCWQAFQYIARKEGREDCIVWLQQVVEWYGSKKVCERYNELTSFPDVVKSIMNKAIMYIEYLIISNNQNN